MTSGKRESSVSQRKDQSRDKHYLEKKGKRRRLGYGPRHERRGKKHGKYAKPESDRPSKKPRIAKRPSFIAKQKREKRRMGHLSLIIEGAKQRAHDLSRVQAAAAQAAHMAEAQGPTPAPTAEFPAPLPVVQWDPLQALQAQQNVAEDDAESVAAASDMASTMDFGSEAARVQGMASDMTTGDWAQVVTSVLKDRKVQRMLGLPAQRNIPDQVWKDEAWSLDAPIEKVIRNARSKRARNAFLDYLDSRQAPPSTNPDIDPNTGRPFMFDNRPMPCETNPKRYTRYQLGTARS